MLSCRTVATVALSLLIAAPAAATTFPLPSVDTRLHTLASGEPGAEWNTGGLGSGGNISYSSGTGHLNLSGELDVLNYFDPNGGAAAGVSGAPCTTDSGSNCAYNFASNPSLTVDADLVGISVTDFGSGFYGIDIDFQGTGGTDILITDSDSTVLLQAQWQAGTFAGNPTTGLSVSATYDSGSGTLLADPTVVGFGAITGGAYAQLFDSGGGTDISLHLSEFFDFSPTTDALAAAIVANYVGNGGAFVDNSALGSFTSEGQGQIFRVASGDFQVPEPASALLLGAGLALAAARRRRRDG